MESAETDKRCQLAQCEIARQILRDEVAHQPFLLAGQTSRGAHIRERAVLQPMELERRDEEERLKVAHVGWPASTPCRADSERSSGERGITKIQQRLERTAGGPGLQFLLNQVWFETQRSVAAAARCQC